MASAANQQSQPKGWDKPIDSIDTVIEAIKYLRMPEVSTQNLILLANSQERRKFKQALEECLMPKGKEVDRETKKYLFGMVSCLSNEVSANLSRIGFNNVPPELLIEIGHSNGMAFRSALQAAVTPTDPNQDLGMSTIISHLGNAANVLKIEYSTSPLPANNEAARANQSSPQNTEPQPLRPASSAEWPEKSVSTPSKPAPAAPKSQDVPRKEPESSALLTTNWLSTHVYGGKAALCFNAAQAREKNQQTLIVDAATAKGEREYEWDKAIKIQLGHKELPLLYAVLAGWRRSVKFSAHGTQNDKSFEIERQEKNFFVKVSAKNEQLRAVKMSAQDAYPVMMVTLTQIIRQVPEELRGKPELIISMMKASQSFELDLLATGSPK